MELVLPPITRPTTRRRSPGPAHAVESAGPPQSSDLDELPAQPAAAAPELTALCLGVARGDHGCITALYRSHFSLVYSTARRITRRDESFGLDAAQDVFLRVLASGAALRAIRTREDLDRWLVRVTHSACIDLLRKEQRRRRRERSRPDAPANTRDTPTDDQIAALRKALDTLDHEDRALIRLRTEGHTLASLAHSLGSTPGSLHGRFRRAMRRLKDNSRESNHE